MNSAAPVTIPIGSSATSGLWLEPSQPRATLVLAHGAGAGMAHRSMAAIAEGLVERGVATLRFNFPYVEQGGKRPDPPAIAHKAVRAAIAFAAERAPKLALFAGGRSFGGRMTSQAEALAPTPAVRGLVSFAFPLHPAGKPGIERAEHLAEVKQPMLFLQGTRDALADIALLRGVIGGVGERARLVELDGADHSFHVPARSSRKDADVMAELLDAAAAWMLARSIDE